MRYLMIAAVLASAPTLALAHPAGHAAEAEAHGHAGHGKVAKAMPEGCEPASEMTVAGTPAPSAKAVAEKQKACEAARMLNNKHPDLMK